MQFSRIECGYFSTQIVQNARFTLRADTDRYWKYKVFFMFTLECKIWSGLNRDKVFRQKGFRQPYRQNMCFLIHVLGSIFIRYWNSNPILFKKLRHEWKSWAFQLFIMTQLRHSLKMDTSSLLPRKNDLPVRNMIHLFQGMRSGFVLIFQAFK